jgi:peroxiredoxin
MTTLRRTIMPGLLVLALVIIAIQGHRIMVLTEGPSQTAGLVPGARVSGFDAFDVFGTKATIAYDPSDLRPTVLYVFSPSCIWCARNAAAIGKITSELSNRYRIIGLSLDSENLALYISDHKMAFPVYTNLPDSVIDSYQLGPTPTTIVIAPNGRVLKTWVGAYTGPTQSSVESFFSIKLPDVS